MKFLIIISIIASLLVVVSGFIPNQSWRIHPDIFGCETGCYMSSAGYPLAYVVDNPHTSPANHASLANAVMGLDYFLFSKFILSYLFWLITTLVVCVVLKALTR